jgi:mRNA-degrading endonuclease RelE of RelBE toxin-antitoxin system
VLEGDPVPYHVYDVAKLEGIRGAYRVRLGGSRVVYVVDWEACVVTVTRIEPRGGAYKGL